MTKDEGAGHADHPAGDGDAGGADAPGAPAPDDITRIRTRGPDRPVGYRPPDEAGNSLGWVHQFRVTPVTLMVILLVLAGLWVLFETTDLWVRLFP